MRTSTVPTSAQKRGVFTQPIFDPTTTRQTASGYVRDPFPNNTIPASALDPAAQAVVDRYPAPNVFSGANEATANNYRRVGSDTTAQDQFDARLDRYFGARHRVFGRYSYLRDDSVPATPLPDGSGNFTATYIGNTLTRADSVVAEHSWNLTPTSVNQLRFGYTRRGFDRSVARDRAAGDADLEDSQHSAHLVHRRAADLRCGRIAAAGTAGERQRQLHHVGDAVHRQFLHGERAATA